MRRHKNNFSWAGERGYQLPQCDIVYVYVFTCEHVIVANFMLLKQIGTVKLDTKNTSQKLN